MLCISQIDPIQVEIVLPAAAQDVTPVPNSNIKIRGTPVNINLTLKLDLDFFFTKEISGDTPIKSAVELNNL